MVHPLLDIESIDIPPSIYLQATGGVFEVFDQHSQDSGNVSYGVRLDDERYFIKTAGSPGDQRSNLLHAERTAYLLNAASLARSCNHPALPRLFRVIQSPDGPMLVYAWAPGELLHTNRTKRENPHSAYQRFLRLPVENILDVLDDVYELHHCLVQQDWVAVDFYDGCLIYDFEVEKVHIVDLDMYHKGPFVNKMGRMFGSSRFMAPEEFILNARIDERTTLYTMGCTAVVFLSDGTLSRASFRGSNKTFVVITRACAKAPADRYGSMADLRNAWFESRKR